MIDAVRVDDVEKTAADFGFPKIPIYCDQHLNDALQELDDAWVRTIGNIRNGNNPGFKLHETRNGQPHWSLLYDSAEKLDDAFFKNLMPKVEQLSVCVVSKYLTRARQK